MQELFIAVVAAAGAVVGGAACAHNGSNNAEPSTSPSSSTSSDTGDAGATGDTGDKSGSSGSYSSSVNPKLSPRAQRDAIIDQLYAQYGGGDTARGLQQGTDQGYTSLGSGADYGKDNDGAKSGTGSSENNNNNNNNGGSANNNGVDDNGTQIGDDARELGHDLSQGAQHLGQHAEQGIANAATSLDRATFAAHCNTVGEGDQPIMVDDQERSFFRQADVVAKCREVARLNDVIWSGHAD